MILEDSLEEEVTNCAIKSSESQHEGHILLFLGVSPQHRWECVLVSVCAHTHPVTGPRPLHQFPTCSRSLSRLCDLWCRPPRDFNLHRDKCNKRNNLEIRAKEDTFTNPSPKVGWGCHHVICARNEAGRGRGEDRELRKAGWRRGSIPTSLLLTLSAGSQWGRRVSQREEDQTTGSHCSPSPITTREHNSITRNTGQNHELQRFISAIQRLYLEERLVGVGGELEKRERGRGRGRVGKTF